MNPPKKPKDKDRKDLLSLSLPVFHEEKPLSHKKSQSGYDFNNNLEEFQQIFTSKSTDAKKIITLKNNSNSIQTLSNESLGETSNLRKEAEIAKNNLLFETNKENPNSKSSEPNSKKNSEINNTAVLVIKRTIYFEQFNVKIIIYSKNNEKSFVLFFLGFHVQRSLTFGNAT